MTRNWLIAFRRTAFVLAALAQLAPANVAVASIGGEFKLVICTPDGAQSVSWEEFTGEPSPFERPDEEASHNPCHACLTSCRIGAVTAASDTCLPNVTLNVAPRVDIAPRLVLITRAAGPPLPSRAPPGGDV